MNRNDLDWKKHPFRMIAILVVVAIVAYFFAVGATGKAEAATVQATVQAAAASTCKTYGGEIHCNKVTKRHKRVARKIRNEAIPNTRASYDMRDAFKNKRAAKRILVKRIHTGLIAMQGQEGVASRGTTRAHARSIYVRAVNNTPCGAMGTSIDDWGLSQAMCRIQNLPDDDEPGEMINKQEVRALGTILFCGTGAAVAIGGSGATLGTSTIGITAAGSCLMGVWAQIDP
jgi:hypothetical protein